MFAGATVFAHGRRISASQGKRHPGRAPGAMNRVLLAALIGALVGGALVWWVGGSSTAGPEGPSRGASAATEDRVAAPPRELLALRAQVARESARNAALAEEIAVLRRAQPAAGGEEVPPLSSEFLAAEDPEDEPSPGTPWFDAAALEAEGFAPDEIDRIRRRWAEYEMDRLEIEHLRARKAPGWKQLGQRSFRIEVDVRRDLGDTGYDAMRFAVGQDNRVILGELLENSPAAEAGLLPGDEIISFDEERVFTAAALKLLTVGGTPGAWTEIRVLRRGEERRFFVPRGPLGTRLEPASRPPLR